MKISINNFKGTAPKLHATMLPAGYAQTSNNVFYGTGALTPIKEAEVELTIDHTKTYKTIYKYDTSSTAYEWLLWEDEVDLARDPIYSDTYNRTCITGLSDAPRIFDSNLLASYTTVTTTNSYKLGLTSPAKATIAVSGSSGGTAETRSYVVAYSRKWADGKIDDGPWSVPAETSGNLTYVDVYPGDSVIVSNIADAPVGYGITEINVYRTVTGTDNAIYQLVISFNITLAKAGSVSGVTWNGGTSKFTFTDTVAIANLGSTGANQLWIAPPDNLQGIISLNNGILAGYSDNYVYFSQPYQCHSWPDSYRVAIDKTITGLGSFGNTIVIGTTGEPYMITMTDPSSAAAYAIKESAPCLAGKSMVSFKDSVVYPSSSGVMRITSSEIVNMTQDIADSFDISDYNISTMFSAGLDTTYYGVFLDNNGQRKIFVFNMAHPEQGISFCDAECTAIYPDKSTTTLYVARKFSYYSAAIAKYNKSEIPLRFTWKSKAFKSEDDSINFSTARVRFASAAVPEMHSYTDTELLDGIDIRDYNEYNINGLPGLGSQYDTNVIFKYYVDGVLVFTKTVLSSLPFRLPAGTIGHYFEVEVSSGVEVYEMDLATSMKELYTEDPYALEKLK